MNMSFKVLLPIFIVVIFTAAMLYVGWLSKKMHFDITSNHYLNIQMSYQVVLIGITTLSIMTTYFLNKENFHQYFSMGNISAAGESLALFGIKKGDTWLKTGLSLSVIITLVTSIFMYFQLKTSAIDWSTLRTGFLWILLLSLTNSFGEEMIFRLGIVSPLKGLLSPLVIFSISAVLFGLPHFAGMPSGIIGATLAGILGFALAKSMYETNGFFWAWFIHFLQDVVIIGALFLMSSKVQVP
jgi:membrane protease YdiL (CAAX protease family)